MAVLTEAIEAGGGAEAVTVSDVVLVGIVTATAPAVTSIVAGDGPALARAHLMTIDTTAPRPGSVTMREVLAVIVTAAVTALGGVLVNLLSSMRTSGTSGLSLCNSLLRV